MKSTSTLTDQPGTSTGSTTKSTVQPRTSSTQHNKNKKDENPRTQSLSPSSKGKQKSTSNNTKISKQGDRMPKGSENPIILQNAFDTLEDMEGDFSDGGSQASKPPFKPQQILPP
jgi:hypothetical protein